MRSSFLSNAQSSNNAPSATLASTNAAGLARRAIAQNVFVSPCIVTDEKKRQSRHTINAHLHSSIPPNILMNILEA
eukprot:m.66192 g.66192  ORF g.66192 m.66192 type:complete len:76 (-) comp18055_c0_seq1:7-234(-)